MRSVRSTSSRTSFSSPATRSSSPRFPVKMTLCSMVAVAVSAAGSPVLAQGTQGTGSVPVPTSRPYRGALSGTADPRSRQSLSFTFTLAEGYDDNVYGDLGQGVILTALQQG